MNRAHVEAVEVVVIDRLWPRFRPAIDHGEAGIEVGKVVR